MFHDEPPRPCKSVVNPLNLCINAFFDNVAKLMVKCHNVIYKQLIKSANSISLSNGNRSLNFKTANNKNKKIICRFKV